MKHNAFTVKKQTGKIDLTKVKLLGNGTIVKSATPFPQRDNIYYQVGPHGDYTQEQGG